MALTKSRVTAVAATAAVLMAAISPAGCSSLQSVCTSSFAQSALPATGTIPGITIDPSSLTATAATNFSVRGSPMYPDATFDYCNVTFAYTHNGRNDRVLVTYWLPDPADFKNRFLATGGGGLAINSGSNSVAGGIPYGAAGGLTDGGFGGFSNQFDSVFLLANNTVNWQEVFMFGYEAIHEMTEIGKLFTKQFFNANGTSSKLYTYYQGCSEGGRDGWSQVQRYADQYDGAIVGAPALRFGFQQVNHLTSSTVEKTLDYYPPPCELQKIVNLTTAACDPLDGYTDGVVSRTDLCKLKFNIKSTIGEPYYCAASSGRPGGGMGPPGGGGGSTPVQNGTVTAKGVAVAQTILDGLKDSHGRQVYLSYQPSATFADAQTSYSNTTQSWGLSVSGLGAEWVERFLLLQDSSSLTPSEIQNNLTYDQLKEWMIYGTQRYEDTLQTTWPDLTPFQSAGGKVLHYHGESDDSIPAASSVRYHESVRRVMYPDLAYNASVAAIGDWYKLFLVPGAGHCSANANQPNGPFPQTNLQVMIDWVERGVEPVTLNATHLAGEEKGKNAQICAWPLRPTWTGNDTMRCEYDQASIDTWIYDLDAISFPVY